MRPQRGRTLAFNGVCGNLGVSLAAGITAALTAVLSWRGAFFVPGVICIVTGFVYMWFAPEERRHAAARSTLPDVSMSTTLAAIIFGLFPRRRGQRRARLQHHLGRVAENRRRAHHRHFTG